MSGVSLSMPAGAFPGEGSASSDSLAHLGGAGRKQGQRAEPGLKRAWDPWVQGQAWPHPTPFPVKTCMGEGYWDLSLGPWGAPRAQSSPRGSSQIRMGPNHSSPDAKASGHPFIPPAYSQILEVTLGHNYEVLSSWDCFHGSPRLS